MNLHLDLHKTKYLRKQLKVINRILIESAKQIKEENIERTLLRLGKEAIRLENQPTLIRR